MVITFLFGALMSTWVLTAVVPIGIPTDDGGIVVTSDPHPHEEWE